MEYQKGLNTVEFLVVVVLIALIVAVVYPQMNKYVNNVPAKTLETLQLCKVERCVNHCSQSPNNKNAETYAGCLRICEGKCEREFQFFQQHQQGGGV